MPESMPYPGSPSLSPEAREKVLQTFRHTLNLAQTGRNEEALLGCDFILKMDARFAPARRLLDALRGIATGTVVDLSGFSDFTGPQAPAPGAAPAPAPAPARPAAAAPVPQPIPTPLPMPAAPAPMPAPLAASAATPSMTGTLDDLSLDDFGAPAPSSPAPAPAFAMPAPTAVPPPPSFSLETESVPPPGAAPTMGAPALDSLGFGEVPDLPALGGAFDSAPLGPPGEMGAPSEGPAAFAMPGPEPAPALPTDVPPPSTLTRGAGAPDPRIVQFLRQGDEAMARGNVQEAIDLWSRVFLIDLSNEEASQRIDRARDAQAENARKVDTLVSEGIQLYDSGDLTGARHRFLDVLAISESDATARSYLNQIEASLSAAPAGGEAPAPTLPDFSSEDIAPATASFRGNAPLSDLLPPETEERTEAGAQEEEEEERPAPPRRTVDVRLLLLAAVVVLLAVGLGTWVLVRKRPPATPAAVPGAASGAANRTRPGAPGTAGAPAASEHPVDRARILFEQGKVEEALAAVKDVPLTDPRYQEVPPLIERIKSTAPPPTPAAHAASLDELRAAGVLAAKESRFIDAVKALDPVVKAHPEDTEAAQELSRSRDQVAAMASAVKSFNEQDYESAIKLLWGLRKSDAKNKDVEEYLFKSYFNQGVQGLQAGNAGTAATSFQEALNLHATDTEAQRHLRFARKYSKGTTELVARIYIRHLAPRP